MFQVWRLSVKRRERRGLVLPPLLPPSLISLLAHASSLINLLVDPSFRRKAKSYHCWHIGHVRDVLGTRLLTTADGRDTYMNKDNVCPLRPFQHLGPFYVTRVGKRVSAVVADQRYFGVVTDENP